MKSKPKCKPPPSTVTPFTAPFDIRKGKRVGKIELHFKVGVLLLGHTSVACNQGIDGRIGAVKGVTVLGGGLHLGFDFI